MESLKIYRPTGEIVKVLRPDFNNFLVRGLLNGRPVEFVTGRDQLTDVSELTDSELKKLVS